MEKKHFEEKFHISTKKKKNHTAVSYEQNNDQNHGFQGIQGLSPCPGPTLVSPE